MEYENKLIRLLNLDAVKNNKVIELYGLRGMVGTIKKIEENKEFYYQTDINFNGFNFTKKRKINDNEYIYNFQIQDKNNRIFIEMNLGNTPYLNLYSKETGVISFLLDEKKLVLNFRTKLSRGNVLENLTIKLDNKSDLQKYFGNYYNYKVKVDNENKHIKKYELLSYANDDYSKVLLISSWGNTEIRDLVKGTIRDTIRLDFHGKDLMERFRSYIDNLFPFETNFLETFLEERGIRNDAFLELYPDLNRYGNYYAIREINNNTLLGIELSKDSIPLKSYGTLIFNLKEVCDFGYLRGAGDYSGSYIWNTDYVFRVSSDNEVEGVFDIKNKKIITDKEEAKKIYQEYESKVLTK